MCTGCTYTNGLANNSSANPGTTWPGAFTTGLQTVFGDRRMCRPWHTHDTRTTGPLLTHNRPASTTRAASPRLRPAQYTAPAPCKFTTTAPHRDHFTTQDVLPKPGTFHAESRHHMEQRRATQALLQKEHARVAARHSVTHILAAATPLGAGTGAPVGLGVWGRARPTRVSCKRVGLSVSAAQAQQLGTHRNKPITVAACGRSLEELRRRAPAWESDRGARSQRARRRGRISS